MLITYIKSRHYNTVAAQIMELRMREKRRNSRKLC